MPSRLSEGLAVVAGLAYLCLLAVAIGSTSYDVWGVLVVIPPLGLVGVMTVRTMFSGDLAALRPILFAGLVAKLVGTALRYWVGFEAYAGGIDAQRYHEFAVQRSADVRDGLLTVFDVIPTGTGTHFVENVTAFVYTLTGSSKMGGFVVFGFIGYLGVLFFVKAACVAIPGLATHRYAALCALAPSLAYWPSSIGKESLMILGIGIATLGIAKFFATGALLWPLLMTSAALVFTGAIRPHIAGIWLAGVFPALLVMFVKNQRTTAHEFRRGRRQATMLVVIGVAAIGLIVLSQAAIRYLPSLGDDQSLTAIVDETTRRTEQAGSAFTPPNITNPINWPFAAVRTLTRPLLIEARGAAQLLTALEMTLLIGLAVASYRRLLHVPKLVLTIPFVTFAITTLFVMGLALSSFANLGVLARQKALVFPFLLLVVCLPELPRRPKHDPEGERQNNSTSPSVSPQLLSGGMPSVVHRPPGQHRSAARQRDEARRRSVGPETNGVVGARLPRGAGGETVGARRIPEDADDGELDGLATPTAPHDDRRTVALDHPVTE